MVSGIADDGLVGLAHVAAEETLTFSSLLLELQLQEGRAQDVPGVVNEPVTPGASSAGAPYAAGWSRRMVLRASSWS